MSGYLVSWFQGKEKEKKKGRKGKGKGRVVCGM